MRSFIPALLLLASVVSACAPDGTATASDDEDLVAAALTALDSVSFEVPEDEEAAAKPGAVGKGPASDGYLAARAASALLNQILHGFVRRTVDQMRATPGELLPDGRRYWWRENDGVVLEIVAEPYADGHVGVVVLADDGVSGRRVAGLFTFTPGHARERGSVVVFLDAGGKLESDGAVAITYARQPGHTELEASAYDLRSASGTTGGGRYRQVRDGDAGSFALESTVAVTTGDGQSSAQVWGRVLSRWVPEGGRSDLRVERLDAEGAPTSGLLSIVECWDRVRHRTTFSQRAVLAVDGTVSPQAPQGEVESCAFDGPAPLALPPERPRPEPPTLESLALPASPRA